MRKFEEAFGEYIDAASEDLLNSKDLEGIKDYSTELPSRKPLGENYLHVNKSFTANTNATKELAEKYNKINVRRKIHESLKFGATEEDLEKEVLGDFGKEILEVMQAHGITGSAVWESLDLLKNYLGKEPNVDESISNWKSNKNQEDNSEEDSAEDNEDDLEESIGKKAKMLRKKILARKILEKQSF